MNFTAPKNGTYLPVVCSLAVSVEAGGVNGIYVGYVPLRVAKCDTRAEEAKLHTMLWQIYCVATAH